MSTATILDDTDPRIIYSSGWRVDGSPKEYNSTTHATTTAGASFTLRFNGTSVKVLGTLTQEGFPGSFPNTSYVLDGTTPVTFSGLPSRRVQYSQIFYQSPVDLPNTEHTLVGTCTDQGSLVWLDFFVVTSPPASSTLTTSQSVVTTTLAASQEASRSASSSSSFPTGAVVGSVIGVVLMAVIFMLLLMWHRRRPVASTDTEMLKPTPYPSESINSIISRPTITIDTSHFPPTTSMYSSPSPIDLPSLVSPSSASTAMFLHSTVPTGSSGKLRPPLPLQALGASTSRNREGGDYHEHPPAYH